LHRDRQPFYSIAPSARAISDRADIETIIGISCLAGSTIRCACP
jgi:hypothetical protein